MFYEINLCHIIDAWYIFISVSLLSNYYFIKKKIKNN